MPISTDVSIPSLPYNSNLLAFHLSKLKTQFFFDGPLYHSIFTTILAGSTFRFSSFSIAFEPFFVCSCCWNQTQYYYVLLILLNHSLSLACYFVIYNTVAVLRDKNGTWDFRLEGCLCCCLWNFGFELLHWVWNGRSNSNSGTRWRYLLSHTLILVQQFLVRIP